jgi:hypothetical protein
MTERAAGATLAEIRARSNPRRARRRGAGIAAVLGALLFASPAAASPETLRRSVSNILFAPFDFFLSPVTAVNSVYHNLQDVDDSTGVRIFYAVPGVAWNTGLYVGISAVRAMAGILELLPGIGLAFFEADLDPLFPPAESQEALVDIETPPLWVKFGILYTS